MHDTDSGDDVAERVRCGVGPLWCWNGIEPLYFVDPEADVCVVVNLTAHLLDWAMGRRMTYCVSCGKSATADDDVA